MSKSMMIVLTRPVPGREDEFNDWYTNRHIADVLAIDGIISASRLKQASAVSGDLAPYCALYEIDAEDPRKVADELLARSGTDAMPLSEAMAPDASAAIFEVFFSAGPQGGHREPRSEAPSQAQDTI